MNIRDIYNSIMGLLSVDKATVAVGAGLSDAVNGVLRWVIPVLVILIVVRCALSLLKGEDKGEVWGYLRYPNGKHVALRHWENLLGRARSADVRIEHESVAKAHAVLTRRKGGAWYLFDIGNKGNVQVNGKSVKESRAIKFGDTFTLGEQTFTLIAPTATEVVEDCQAPREAVVGISPLINQILLSVFSMLGMMALMVNIRINGYLLLLVFGGMNLVMWGYYFLMRGIGRSGYEVEHLAFLLTLFGLCITAVAAPYGLLKQFVAVVMGVILFLFLGWCLRDLSRSQVMRWIMSAVGLILLLLVFFFAQTINGARNWLFIGGMSIQPSELAKICFVYAGAATLDRLMTKRNLLLYIVFAGACVGLLALMNDFGTALIFFLAFLVVAFLRSGQLSTILLGGASAGLATVMVLTFRPYVLGRFKAWRNVWAYADSLGYQQTWVMTCAASGGMLGLGIGRGWLKHVAAADTDLVFGMICEEWGMITAVCVVLVIVLMAVFTVKQAGSGRSTFYSIASCTAVSILVVQTMLNVCGSVDVLPLTGVTFPFISNGGSSMLCAWGLLAFIKAADVRPGASFAIKQVPFRLRRARHE